MFRRLFPFFMVALIMPLSHAQKPKPLAPIEDVPGLPRVLLIGDSISVGYTLAVREALAGIANVHRPPENCGPTLRGLTNLDAWLGEKPWDVIHFNWGLHDLKYIAKDSETRHQGKLTPVEEGEQMVPLDEYRQNLEQLVERLRKTGASLIWRNTTPVPKGAKGRVPGDAVKYNEVAATIMRTHSIPTDDLHTFAKERLSKIQRKADVHFTPDGSTALAGQVSRAIFTALPLDAQIQTVSKRLPAIDALSASETLPDPLVNPNGERLTNPHDWPEQRAYLKEILAHYEYGHAPAPPNQIKFQRIREDQLALNGQATKKEIRIHYGPDETPPLDLLVYTPNDRTGPVPIILGLNFRGNHATTADPEVTLATGWIPEDEGVVDHRATPASRGTLARRWPYEEVIARGYAVATVYHGDMDPDKNDSSGGIQSHLTGKLSEDSKPHQWASLRAWAYGLSRAADYLVQDPDIDPARIAVMGHSRNGKTALVAGAFDERFALIISNQSGCGGAALSRPARGETVTRINTSFPHWFNGAFKHFNDREAFLPFDQHTLIAACAPRPVLICSATGDTWADPQGEFEAAKAAGAVYEWLGKGTLAAESLPEENTLIDSVVGYHIRPGKHSVGSVDWKVFVDFAEKHWR